MCGIVAISSTPDQSYPLNQVLQAIEHRGPDDLGTYVSKSADCHLGHVRLSIIDLSAAGHQPMFDRSGRYVISFNGEIYNYQELKRALEKDYGGIGWKGHSDTEVIVEGVAREGVEFLGKLNGIFALALYDQQEQKLHLLRDPLGIKPLFVTEQSGAIFFCSELKGLMVIPELKRSLRLDSFAEQLGFMYVPEPYTLYQEFSKVEPGVCITYQKGVCVAQKYLFPKLWDVEPYVSEDEAIKAFQSTFAKAVERQLIADVPVSLFLSGGLDSSAIAWQAVNGQATIQDAYTISFSDDDQKYDLQTDDLRYARQMADYLGIKLQVITAKKSFLSLLPNLIHFMEDGFSDPAAINTYLISTHAREQGVKVMLSGQGADEFLGGYRRYLAERMLRSIPAPLLNLLSKLEKLLPVQMPGRLNAFNRRLRRFSQLAGKPVRLRILGMYSWATPNQIRELFVEPPDIDFGEAFIELLDSYHEREIVDAMLALDYHYALMSLNLCYTDRMSMATGVETRVPFLDFDLIRVMNSIPANLKVKGREGKYLLKKAMEPYLPHDVIYRSKAGFGLPIRSWLSRDDELLKCYLDGDRLKQQGLFNEHVVSQLIKEQMSGAKDHSYLLMTLLVQQVWLDNYSVH